MSNRKIRTLVQIGRHVWSQTKAYASLEGYTVSDALEKLLIEILSQKGYTIQNDVSELKKQGRRSQCS